jgi:hypothetical protein
VDLPFKNSNLVTQDHEFDVLVGCAQPGRHDERQNPAQPEVRERKGHRSMMTGVWANCQLRALIEIVAPFIREEGDPRLPPGHGLFRSQYCLAIDAVLDAWPLPV